MRKIIEEVIRRGDKQEITRLLDEGIHVNQKDDYGTSLLEIACTPMSKYSKPNIEVIGLLLDRGADIDCRDRNGNTPLMNAWLPTQRTLVQYLLDRGANINAKNNEGKTALHLAINRIASITSIILLDNRANVIAKDDKGNTPLHYAKDKYLAEILLERGAALDLENDNKETPVEVWHKRWKEEKKLGICSYNIIVDLLEAALFSENYQKVCEYLAQYCKVVNLYKRGDKNILDKGSYRERVTEKLEDLADFRKHLIELKEKAKKLYKREKNKNQEGLEETLNTINKMISKINYYIRNVDDFYNSRILNDVVMPVHGLKSRGLEK